jgi:hypothetical protein
MVDDAIALLAESVARFPGKWGDTELTPGLTDEELALAESRYSLKFGPDHARFLTKVLPVGRAWPNWRDAKDAYILGQLARLEGGVLFDVENNAFWPWSWGARPRPLPEALALAGAKFAEWPKLVPLRGGRYLPGAPSEPGAPVFSAHQTDVIYYGHDLLAWVQAETGPNPDGIEETHGPDYLPPWSMLAYGYGQGEYPPARTAPEPDPILAQRLRETPLNRKNRPHAD